MDEKSTPRELSEAELDHVTGGSAIHQGSGKNPSGKKVDVFSGNPHNAPDNPTP
jgi:hypothetical protein